MKNISRRVFIKGLAVAGVAAAASTVLAGCNTSMIPGVGTDTDKDEEVTEPAATNKYTFTTVDGKTLVISAPSAVTTVKDADGKVNVVIPVTVDNKLDAGASFGDTVTTGTVAETAATYFVTLSAKVYNDAGNSMTDVLATSAADDLSWAYDNLIDKNGVTVKSGASVPYAIGFALADTMANWGNIVITAKVYEKAADVSGEKYVYNQTEVDKYDFKYTR